MTSIRFRYPLIPEQHRETPRPERAPSLLLLGTCASEILAGALSSAGIPTHHYLCESFSHSAIPDVDAASHDAVAVVLTLRHIFIEASYRLFPDQPLSNCIYWPRAVEEGRLDDYFSQCRDLIGARVARLMGTLGAMPRFFASFLEPKHNYLGNLLPRYSLSNPSYFVQRLNEELARCLTAYDNAHFLDLNELTGLVGRARLQDDYIDQIAHASFIVLQTDDAGRHAASTPPVAMYESNEAIAEFGTLLAARLRDDLAILAQPLTTKAIIVDLDDTLWRGTAADDEKPDYEFIEGWPLGLAEALLVYKTRGGMLAVCSRNDRSVIERRFNDFFHRRLTLNDFASVQINYDLKSASISRILNDLNILEENALFIDDNPREVDEVRAVFPKLQTLSAEHFDWRRKILMSPSMQVAAISEDASRRTPSVQAKVARDTALEGRSREEWLASLGLVQELITIDDTGHPRFPRAFELLNKTNQFNTTGTRWTLDDVKNLFARGGAFLCSTLRDRLVDNGMVMVVVVCGDEIVQAVLSCRAFQLGAEQVAGHAACETILRRHPEVTARLVDTGKNFSCHGYFRAMGFTERDGRFVTRVVPGCPSHITVTREHRAAASVAGE